jgi:hypothetical protein
MSRTQRTRRARQAAQTAAAETDRTPNPAPIEAKDTNDAAPAWPDQGPRVRESIDADRRRRRRDAVAGRPPVAPPRMGTSLRRSLFLVPDEDTGSTPPSEGHP